ncbi:HAD family hydrolase [Actinomadura barringtoniae]|uniref:HAD family hydrolase n=1 Tax=Actinomadura barringtoniae TaxID=1427535 RepID=A0A939T513_9ACTN|nr:HAD family hydrolase [Actinomadura barringtoniae]MBO2448959.1 HAD family hydrolase [Actinomadura barringtoniae]
MSVTKSAALFDVDGTLVDSNYLHAVTWWEAFRQAGHQVPMARVHRAIGMGSDLLLDHLLPEERDQEADDGIRTAHAALYATYWSRLAPLPGAAELLKAVAERGLRVVLASSAAERELGVMREVLDAESAILAATSSSSVERSKPAPDLVQAALEKAEVEPDQAVFVGDTRWDVQAAQRAKVPCVGLLSGGIGENELAGAVAIYRDAAHLLEELDDSPLLS